MSWLLCLAVAGGALVLGLVVGFGQGRRTVRGRAVAPSLPPSLAELLHRSFHSSGAGLAIIGRNGDVVLHNAAADKLGVVRSGQPDSRVWAAGQQAFGSEDPIEVDLTPLDQRRRTPVAVVAKVRPIGEGFLVVEAADASEAARLEATRRDFVANVSHELKTPVGAIGLLAEAVLDAADDPTEVRRFATRIVSEASRLGKLVSELIALSRLTGAEPLPELRPVQVDDVVDEALTHCRLSAESAAIHMTTDQASGLTVCGDRTLLVTAVSNLVENAIAYSPQGASVSVSRRLDGDWVEIAVTDRGIGIAPEHQTRVFERFFRVDPARSRATGGTGLGLAIVKHVVANHGGEVRLWSRLGTGSTFTIRLPARLPAEPSRTAG